MKRKGWKQQKISEKDEESSTLQTQKDRGREIKDEHSVIRRDKEKMKNWGPFER